MRNFAALVLGLIACLAALPAYADTISMVSIFGEAEASINADPMSVFLTQPGTNSITRDEGNEYAFASVTAGYTPTSITAATFADVDHPFQTGYSSGEVAIDFVVNQWVDLVFLNIEYFSAVWGGVGLTAGMSLHKDGEELWQIREQHSDCTDLQSPPLSCSLLEPGTYTLMIDASAYAGDAGPNTAQYSTAAVELEFTPCDDPDGDGVCTRIDTCPNVSNPAQTDTDGDLVGDACDNCPLTGPHLQFDDDNDGVGNVCDNCAAVANPTQTDGDEIPVSDWAVTAIASSEISSTFGAAQQATGPPQWPGACLSVGSNWAPDRDGPTDEWLELTFGAARRVTGIEVNETFEGGFVSQIELRDTDGNLHTVWSGSDSTVCGELFSESWPATSYYVDSAIVHTSTNQWEEIDAVRLLALGPDGTGNACDNCPGVGNPDQMDADSDGAGDACDCAPNNPLIRPATDVGGVSIEKIGTVVRVNWAAADGATSYTFIRGTLSQLSAGNFGACIISGLTVLTADDGDSPLSGDPFFYLIQGANPDCGPGTIGYDWLGHERDASGVGTCP